MNTQVKKIFVSKFRALENIEISIGKRITLICGKNGTAKSSLLGLIAQGFNFQKIYFSDKEPAEISHSSLLGTRFKSMPREHFRLSTTYDKPGEAGVTITV